MTIYGDLCEALETTPRLPRDAAAVALARRYAAALDDLFDTLANDPDANEDRATHSRVILEITRIGGRFEAVMDKLGMMPASRPAVPRGEGAGGDPASDSLDALRADAARGAPASGIDYAAAVDPSVTEADTAY